MIIFVALPPWKFSGRYPCTVGCTNLLLSQERRLYLHPTPRRGPPLPLPTACSVLAFAIVVEPCPHQALAADCPLLRCLGFNLAPSSNFFLFSLPSRSGVSHPHVVVLLALGVPSISKGRFSNTLPCKRTEWLQCLKFHCTQFFLKPPADPIHHAVMDPNRHLLIVPEQELPFSFCESTPIL